MLCILILIQLGFTYATTERLILRPLTIYEHDRSLELRHAHAKSFSKLDPQSHGQLTYGGTPGSVQLYFEMAQSCRED